MQSLNTSWTMLSVVASWFGGRVSDQSKTNSAMRLHTLLVGLKSKNFPNRNLFQVLPEALHTQQADQNAAALDAIVTIYKMFQDVEREIESAFSEPKKQSFYMKSIPNLRAAFSPMSFGAAWDNHKTNLKDTDLVALENVGMVLEDLISENLIPADRLAELIEAIDELMGLFRQASLPRLDHLFFMDLLENFRMAVQEYGRRGAEGLKEALAAYLGGLALCHVALDGAFDKEQKSKIWEVVGRASDVITLAQASWIGLQLASPIVEVLHKLVAKVPN